MRIISQALPTVLALTFAFGTIATAQTPEQMAMVEKALKMIEGLDARNARLDLPYLKVIADETFGALRPEMLITPLSNYG